MNLIMMGPVGSGKSTQAKLLAESLGVSLLNVGDLLHFAAKEESPTGKKIEESMNKGDLVDEKLTLSLVVDHLNQKEHRNGVVVDGFPRSMWEAENFSFPLDRVVYLEVSDKENKKRLMKRGRKDDTPTLITTRLAVYHQHTKPILKYYREKGILLEIDGERSIEAIHDDLVSRLKSHASKN